MTDAEVNAYGFRWGPVTIQRNVHMTSGAYKGYRSMSVLSHNGQCLKISISPTGKSLRRWLNGKRMEAVDD